MDESLTETWNGRKICSVLYTSLTLKQLVTGLKCINTWFDFSLSTQQTQYKKKSLLRSSYLPFIAVMTSVTEGERSWQPNTFCLWTEIICLLFYSCQQKLNHKVSNVHIKELKGEIGLLLSLCPALCVTISLPLFLLLFAHCRCGWK